MSSGIAASSPGPRAVTCYVCGRQYGTASIGIHSKQCLKLFEEQEAKKPMSQRRPAPSAPEDYSRYEARRKGTGKGDDEF